MSRQAPWISVAAAALLGILSGCQPQMPFYLKQPADGELSHYIGVATELEQPDVSTDRLADVSEAKAPLSLKNRENQQIWDLTLEEAIQTALKNNKVMRTIGGQVQGPPDFILRNPDLVPTIYDPALAESNPRTSAEAALSVLIRAMTTPLNCPGWAPGLAMRLNCTPAPCNNGCRHSAITFTFQSAV